MENSNTDIFSILRIPAQYRQAYHIESLMRLTLNVDFFTRLSTEHNFAEIHRDCCKVMTLEEYSESDFIINFGDKGEKFYIILTGSVSVKTPIDKKVKLSKSSVKKLEKILNQVSSSSSDQELQEESFRRGKKIKIKLPNFANNRKNHSENQDGLSAEEKELLGYFKNIESFKANEMFEKVKNAQNEEIFVELTDFMEIGILYEGSSFGELALIKGAVRSASVQAREKSSFLVMKHNDFKRILGAVSEKKLTNQVKFLQKVQYFHAWSKSALTKIAYFMETIKFKKNQVIYKEGDPASGVYFIKSGEIVIEKRKPDKPIIKSPVFSSSPKNFLQKSYRKIKTDTDLKIIIKSRFEAFGGFEPINYMSHRIYSTVCSSSTCEVLFITRSSFLNRVPHLDLIKPMILEENERIIERFAEINEKEKKNELKSLTPTILNKNEGAFHTNVSKIFKLSSNGAKSLTRVNNLSANRFLRKLTKNEIEEAVNGRASHMRMYGSKIHILNSSFGSYLKKQFNHINLLGISPH